MAFAATAKGRIPEMKRNLVFLFVVRIPVENISRTVL